ncbi:MAG: alginate lyase family protein [Terracidiphilus sp.]|jgi:poly(beta-D-mannuronate) lyase
MRYFFRSLSFLLLLAFAATGAMAEQLHSPWDNRAIVLSGDAYDCPAPPPFARTVEASSYYIDSHASIADPAKFIAFQKASEPSTHLSQFATIAADAYLYKGNRAAALCVYSLLDTAAKADAWAGHMPSFQGVYVQNWLLSAVAISYLKVRSSGQGTPAQNADIQRWFKHLAAEVREYFDAEVIRLASQGENNHIYWAGLAVAAAGIADNDQADFKWGLNAYRMGMDAILPDGSLKAEMNRAQMALHYHLYALGPLIILAELGVSNGIDMYGANKGAIHRLVNFCVAGLEDPTLLQKRTGVAQLVTLPYGGSDIGWAVPYLRRFTNAQLSALAAKAQVVRYTSWGGAPPD